MLTPKILQAVSSTKVRKASRKYKPIPDNWENFARLCDIRSGSEGVVKFDPYFYQHQVISSIESSKTTIVAKGRQLGLTECTTNYFLWKACIKKGYLGVIFSRTQSDTSNIAKRLRRMVESISDYVTPISDSLTDLELSSGGRILFRNSTAFGSRGLESVHDILFDEAAFVDEIDEIFKSAIPTTSMLGDKARIVILSTPNAQSGWYFDKLNSNNGSIDLLQLCEDIRSLKADPLQIWKDDKGWNKVLVSWRAHPIYKSQPDYLEKVAESTGLPEADVRQEYDLSFTDSAESVFNASVIRSAATLDGLSKTCNPNSWFYLGVDGSSCGSDYTVCIVLEYDLKTDKYTVCDLYRKQRSSIESDLYNISQLIDKYSRNIKSVSVESNGVGQIFLERLAINHTNVLVQGVHTSQDSKIAMIDRLSLALETGVLHIPKTGVIAQELLSFRRVGKKLEAAPGSHDDSVMALAIGLSQSQFRLSKPKLNISTIQTF